MLDSEFVINDSTHHVQVVLTVPAVSGSISTRSGPRSPNCSNTSRWTSSGTIMGSRCVELLLVNTCSVKFCLDGFVLCLAWVLHLDVDPAQPGGDPLLPVRAAHPPVGRGALLCTDPLLTYPVQPTRDICSGSMSNTTMCPICDIHCDYWKLQEACKMTKAKV